MSGAADLRWFAVLTKPRAERLAEGELLRQGYRTLYLHYPATVSHARRRIGVLKPYFPRYVFVGLSAGQAFAPVVSTPGVSEVVSSTDGPLPIPADVIAELASRGDDKGKLKPEVLERAKARPRFAKGDVVRIGAGSLEGLLVTVALDEGERVRVWLGAFGGEVDALVSPTLIEPASPERWTMEPPRS